MALKATETLLKEISRFFLFWHTVLVYCVIVGVMGPYDLEM